eukprot:Clim_evm36s147 gene=Clim_evmTU36s147
MGLPFVSLLVTGLLGVISTCGLDIVEESFSFDFAAADKRAGFQAILADYDQQSFNSHIVDPRETEIEGDDPGDIAFYLEVENKSDDVFIGLIKKIEGFVPNKLYGYDACVSIGTRESNECIGIGGGPGTSQYVKIGVFNVQPQVRQDREGIYRFSNIDIGFQSQSGPTFKVVGTMGHDVPCDGTTPYLPKILESRAVRSESGVAGNTIVADETGAIWLMSGVDSGFEGKTTLFITDMHVTFLSVDDSPDDNLTDGDNNNQASFRPSPWVINVVLVGLGASLYGMF